MVHDVKIPPVESLDCLYVGRSFGVGVRGGSDGEEGGVIDLGTLGQKREMKAQSRQIPVIEKEYLIEREREGMNEGKEEEFPKEQRTVQVPMYRLFFMALPFTRSKASVTILKKRKRNIFLVRGSVSLPLFHQQREPPVAPENSVKNNKKKRGRVDGK